MSTRSDVSTKSSVSNDEIDIIASLNEFITEILDFNKINFAPQTKQFKNVKCDLKQVIS